MGDWIGSLFNDEIIIFTASPTWKKSRLIPPDSYTVISFPAMILFVSKLTRPALCPGIRVSWP